MEAPPIIHGIITANQISTVCEKRKPFQLRCEDEECVECDGLYMDLEFVWSLYIAPLLARTVIGQLPKKKARKFVETDMFGCISPNDID